MRRGGIFGKSPVAVIRLPEVLLARLLLACDLLTSAPNLSVNLPVYKVPSETRVDQLVDAVVVHHNRIDLTSRCVEALARDQGPLRTVTIIDSGSVTPISDSQQRLWGDLLGREKEGRRPIGLFIESFKENVGFADGNNRGLALRIRDGAGFYLILNNDAYLEPRTLELMVDTALESGAGMVAPAVYQAGDPERVDRFGLTLTRSGAGYDRKNESDGPLLCPSGCAALYRRDLVLELMGDPEGFFDRRFEAYAEDLDVGLRARARGYRVAFAARAKILHEGGATFGPSSPQSYFLRHRNTIWTIAKNFSTKLLYEVGFWLILGQLAGIANGVRRRRFSAVVRGKIEGARGWREFRRRTSNRTKVSDLGLLDHRFWIRP